MKKLLGVSLAVVLCFGASMSHAAGAARGAKPSVAVNYTTTVSTIALQTPAVLYSVILGTGVAGDFVAIFDTGAVAIPNINSGQISSASNLKMRLYNVGAASQTIVNFDPPLQFNNGIIAAPSTALGAYLFVFERGRVTQGY